MPEPTDRRPVPELDPDARAFLDRLDEVGYPPPAALSVGAARERSDVYPEVHDGDDPPAVGSVRDLAVPGPGGAVPVRIYAPAAARPVPTMVYFHGGGWVLGGLDSHDDVCRRWVDAAGHVVVAVDYRRAPEHPFPAAVADARAATAWAADRVDLLGGDPEALCVGGDSAGGTLAAAVALAARDHGGPDLAHQVLVYPVTDHAFDTDSYRENAEGYFLTRESMRWFWDRYLRSPLDGANPYASPLRAPSLSGLPPATVLTCGFDVLRDEGRAYADRLAAAGVPVTRLDRDDQIHGFLSFAHHVDAAGAAVADLADSVAASLGGD
jgi:acetyl esterase